MKYTEIQRLHALRTYNILDTEPEKIFDDITNIISRVCKTEIALISFVDENRQWFKSKVGIEICETPRNISFCGHAIEQEEILVIEDTLQNEIFKNHPMVIGEPHLRFYAGAVLKTPEGLNIGTLCVADRTPRAFDTTDRDTLKMFARMVMSQIELKRKSSELILERSAALQQEELLNALPDFTGTCDLDGMILSYNFAFEEICKQESKKNIFDYFPVWVRNNITEVAVPKAIEHGIWRGESAIYNKTGEELHVFQTIICHRDPAGYPKSFSTILQNMNDIKSATNRFETLTKLAPVGIYMTDSKGVPTFFNQQWFKMTGMTHQQAFGDNGFGSFAALHEDDLERVIECWFNTTQEKKDFKEEFRYKNFITGKIHYIRSIAFPLRDAKGVITGYIGATEDITQEKELTAKLTSSVKQLKTFIQNLPAAVAMLDKELRYIAVSKRWLETYGATDPGMNEHSIIGKSHYEIFPVIKPEWKIYHQEALNGIGRKMNDDSFVRIDGITEWLNWDVRPWYNERNEIGGIIMLTEVTTSSR